jgi:hypothetical protein
MVATTTDTTLIPGLVVVKRDGAVLFVCDAFSVKAVSPGYEDPIGACQVSFQGWTRTVPVSIDEMTKALQAARTASERRYVNQEAQASIARHAKSQSPS